MLANLRRKVGLTVGGVPPLMSGGPHGAEVIMGPPTYMDPNIVPPPPHFSVEELGWPSERGVFSPSNIPLWLQEQVSAFFESHIHIWLTGFTMRV